MPKLLIVDDEVDVREFAANFFRKRKIDVTIAGDGEEALTAISNDAPDLVLLDIKMIGLDGVQTLKRIRKFDTNLKVIMVTGKKAEEDAAYDVCKALGALEYIHKPLQLEELEQVVFKHLKPVIAGE
jgi:DNA-binding response OmpR family regulator